MNATIDIDLLAEKINEQLKRENRRATEDEDSGYAEYAKTYGYGETTDRDLWGNFCSNSHSRIAYQIIDALELIPLHARVFLLKEHAELYTANIYRREGEIFGVLVGEIEVEIDEDLSGLTEEQYQDLRGMVDYYLPERNTGYAYIDGTGDRWVMAVDLGGLAEELFKEQRS